MGSSVDSIANRVADLLQYRLTSVLICVTSIPADRAQALPQQSSNYYRSSHPYWRCIQHYLSTQPQPQESDISRMALRSLATRLRPALLTRRTFAKPTKKRLEWTDEMEARVLQQMRGESNSFGAATLEDTNEKRTHISEVDAGGFELRGDVFVPTSICCLPYHAFLWRARVQEDVTVESLKLFTVVHPRPEIVVVGLGARGPRERLADVEAHFREEGIALEQMDTPNAVHTFNILNDEGRTVGGAFLTLEPRGIDEYADPLADKVT